MKSITTLLALLLVSVSFGQTNHTIYAENMSWSISNLTIETGDSVTFINDHQGVHNVNGTQAIFPNNPESFGRLTKSDNWVYGFRFNTPGRYDFRDDSYASIMTGTITVVDQLGVDENQAASFVFYPNPVINKVTISTEWVDFNVTVIDMMGSKVQSNHLFHENVVDLSNVPKGTYFLQISSNEGVFQERFIKI